MELERNRSGGWDVKTDGTKADLLAFASHLLSLSKDGVGKDLDLVFGGHTLSFMSPREVFFFGWGLQAALNSGYATMLEQHAARFVRSIYGDLSQLPIEGEADDD